MTAALSTRMELSKLHLVAEGFENPRTISGLEAEAIRALAISIVVHGLYTPLLVTAGGLVIAGSRRYRALRLIVEWAQHPGTRLSFEDEDITPAVDDIVWDDIVWFRAKELAASVPVRVLSIGTDITNVALGENVLRADLSSYEIARYMAIMVAQGKTGVQIARVVGKSTTYVSRKLAALRGAGPDLLEAWRAGELADETVQRIAEMPLDKQAKAIAGDTRIKRGPAHRPPIDMVKDVLAELELAPATAPISEYAAGYAAAARDALRWVAGAKTSEAFVALIDPSVTT